MFNLNYKLYCHNPNSVGRYTKYIAALHNNNNINERTMSQNNKNINTNKPLNHDNINNNKTLNHNNINNNKTLKTIWV